MNTLLLIGGLSLMLGSILIAYPVWMPIYRVYRYRKAIRQINAPKK